MNTLKEAIDDYVRLRRDLGFKLIQPARWLEDFAAFMERRQAPFITSELALQWALQPAHGHPSYWAKRLSTIRRFARYRSATDPQTEVPPAGALPHHPKRAKPYLYTEEDIRRLLHAAAALPSANGSRGQTYRCLLGLLVVTGLRIGEALALKRDDVDLQAGLLMIRNAKFNKSRWVPLHRSTQEVLLTYARQRDQHPGATDYFFVSASGKPLKASSVRHTFRRLRQQIGLHGSADCDEPRLHHFRHRFAMETLLQWYRSDDDVERRLPVLSTFLGHSRVADTFWYLSTCPELMAQAVRRLEQRWEPPR